MPTTSSPRARGARRRPALHLARPRAARRLLETDEALGILRRFDRILVGGQSTPPLLLAQALELGLNVTRTYGSSETSGGCVYDGVPIGNTRCASSTSRSSSPEACWPRATSRTRNARAARFRLQDGVRWYRTGDTGTVEDGHSARHGPHRRHHHLRRGEGVPRGRATRGPRPARSCGCRGGAHAKRAMGNRPRCGLPGRRRPARNCAPRPSARSGKRPRRPPSWWWTPYRSWAPESPIAARSRLWWPTFPDCLLQRFAPGRRTPVGCSRGEQDQQEATVAPGCTGGSKSGTSSAKSRSGRPGGQATARGRAQGRPPGLDRRGAHPHAPVALAPVALGTAAA